MSKTRIIVADDHDVVRKGLTFLLGRIKQTEVVGEATDGHQAVELAEKLAPTLVIMDVAMPLLNGIDAAAQILKRRPEEKELFRSVYGVKPIVPTTNFSQKSPLYRIYRHPSPVYKTTQ